MVKDGSVKIVIMSVAACLKKSSIFTVWKDITVEKLVIVSTYLFIFFLESSMPGICNVEMLDPLSILVPHEVPMLVVSQV